MQEDNTDTSDNFVFFFNGLVVTVAAHAHNVVDCWSSIMVVTWEVKLLWRGSHHARLGARLKELGRMQDIHTVRRRRRYETVLHRGGNYF